MDRATAVDEFSKLIIVDFQKKKINLSIEYQSKYKDIEIMKKNFRDNLVLLGKITGDNTYVNHVLCQFLDVTRFAQDKLDSTYSKDRDG